MIGAVDIGGTKIAVGIVEENGRLLSKTESPTDVNDYARGLEFITSMLQHASRDANTEIAGIGIGSTGPVDPFTGEMGEVDFLPGWWGRRLCDDLKATFKVEVFLENDADAAALGEALWGIGREMRRLIYVTIGTGIGGGIVLDGRLYRGVDGAHPELGHQIIDPSGPPCSCGFRGCWESLASGPAVAAWFLSQLPAACGNREHFTAKDICRLAREGDALACQAVEWEGRYLGLGLANLVTLLTPDIIVLGGSLMKSADLFLGRIRRVIEQGCRFVPSAKTEVTLASLGENANLIGAASVWLYRREPAGRRA